MKATLRLFSAACAGLIALSPAPAGTAAPGASTYLWNNVVVGGGGFSPNVLFSTAEPGLAYLRTDIGGIYRYDQTRQRWLALQDGMSEGNYFGVESIAADPVDANVVYAAVGMYSIGPAAILRSENRGASWQVFPVPFRMGGNEEGRGLGERLAIDPNDTRILFFGSRHDGLQRSADRGRTWSRVATFPVQGLGAPAPYHTHGGISFVLFDPSSGSGGKASRDIYVGVADPGTQHVFRSTDAGASWQALKGGPGEKMLPVRGQLASNGVLYLTYSNGIGPNGITDGAAYAFDVRTSSWRDITPPRAAGGFMGLAIDRSQPQTLLVATVDCWANRDTIWRSTDAGAHWESLRARSDIDASGAPFLRWGESHADFGWWMAGVAIDPFNPAHVVYTTGATLYSTEQFLTPVPQRIVWRPWVEGIEETAILSLASPPLGPPLLSGFGDIGGFGHDDLHASPSSFTNPAFDNTNSVAFAAASPNVVVRTGRLEQSNLPAAAWSQDFGRHWTPLLLPPRSQASTTAHPRESDAALSVSADGTTFIAMQGAPMRSEDRGQHWTAVQGLPSSARPVADGMDPQRFYASDNEGADILVSEDGGRVFTPLASRGLPPHDCTAPAPGRDPWPLLAVPGRPQDLWLLCGEKLYHSPDGGRNFTQRTSDVSVSALSFGKPKRADAYPPFFAIGRRGDLQAIWRSDDEGAHWVRINDAEHEYGRRFRVISADQQVYGRVYIGTDGRGIIYGVPSP